jgi:hypothetical protein
VYTLQIKPAPTPWDNWGTYKDYLFPSANSFLQFIRTYPVLYCDFIFLSLSQGFRNVIEIFGPLLILPPLSLFFERFEVNRPNKTPINRLLLVTLVGLVPIQIFAFLHERYITRFYPLMIILALLFLEKQIHSKQKFNQLTVASVVITSITINIILLFRDLYPHFPSGIYWFPD